MERKIIAVLLVVLLVFALAACGQTGVAENTAAEAAAEPETESETAEIVETGNAYADYDAKGYTHGAVCSAPDDNENIILTIYFNSPDRTDCVRVDAVLTDEEIDALDALDFFDEQFYTKQWEIITSIPAERITVTSLNDRIPSADEVNSYVGKTIGDLIKDGYELYTEDRDENGNRYSVYYNYDTFVHLKITIEDTDSFLSDEELAAQVITSAGFDGFDE